jgi:hypothetical protein
MKAREEEFLDALYLGVRDQSNFDRSLGLLCPLFDVAGAALIDFDAARPEVSLQTAVGLFAGEAAMRYQRDFAALDPAPAAFMSRPAGTAIPTCRLLPEEYRRPGVFLAEFFRPLGLEECLGGTLASSSGRFALIGLHRAADRKPFDDEDMGKLERLMPHLSRALQLRRAFFALERKAGGLAESCDRLAAGIVGLDAEERSLFVNAAAQAMALANDGLAIDREGRLFALDRSANQLLAELGSNVRAGGAGGTVRVPRSDGKPAYLVIVAPLFLDERVDGDGRRRGTLVIIHDPLSRPPSLPDLIAGLFNLPLGAANVLSALATGEDLKLYAERSGISMNTVRFHLKTAYARTGARRQGDLVRLVTTAMRDLADHR